MSLYNATGGPYWAWVDPIPEASHDLFFDLIADLTQLGVDHFDPTLLNSSLVSALSASDLAELRTLSVNCTLQQALSFGQLLLKHEWGEPDRSYCSWHGRTAIDRPCSPPQPCCITYVRLCCQAPCIHCHLAVLVLLTKLAFVAPPLAMPSLAVHAWRAFAGITCCKTAGDRLSNYCTAPQSVAQIYLPGKLRSMCSALPQLQSSMLLQLFFSALQI